MEHRRGKVCRHRFGAKLREAVQQGLKPDQQETSRWPHGRGPARPAGTPINIGTPASFPVARPHQGVSPAPRCQPRTRVPAPHQDASPAPRCQPRTKMPAPRREANPAMGAVLFRPVINAYALFRRSVQGILHRSSRNNHVRSPVSCFPKGDRRQTDTLQPTGLNLSRVIATILPPGV